MVRGLYRYVRNPMYLSVTVIVLGEVLLTGSRALLGYWAVWFALSAAGFLPPAPTPAATSEPAREALHR